MADPALRLRLAPPIYPRCRELIPASVRALSVGHYTPQQIESAIRYVFGPDTQLIADGTYFVVEAEGHGIVGCGGWSRRRTIVRRRPDERGVAARRRFARSGHRTRAHPRIFHRARLAAARHRVADHAGVLRGGAGGRVSRAWNSLPPCPAWRFIVAGVSRRTGRSTPRSRTEHPLRLSRCPASWTPNPPPDAHPDAPPRNARCFSIRSCRFRFAS